eukprot:2542784-Amphidinium_carterae.1
MRSAGGGRGLWLYCSCAREPQHPPCGMMRVQFLQAVRQLLAVSGVDVKDGIEWTPLMHALHMRCWVQQQPIVPNP